MNASATALATQKTALTSLWNDPEIRDVKREVILKVLDLGIKYPTEFTEDTYKADCLNELLHRVRADKGLTEIYRRHLAA